MRVYVFVRNFEKSVLKPFNDKSFIFYFWHTSWYHISLGFHIDLSMPNVEIHLPFCFFRIGWGDKKTKEYYGKTFMFNTYKNYIKETNGQNTETKTK